MGAGLGADAAAAGTASAAGLSDTGTRAPSSASTSRASHQAAIATVHLPPYLGVKAMDTLAPLLSLILLILLTAGATIVTAGRPLSDDDRSEATVVTLTTDPRRGDIVPAGATPPVDEPRGAGARPRLRRGAAAPLGARRAADGLAAWPCSRPRGSSSPSPCRCWCSTASARCSSSAARARSCRATAPTSATPAGEADTPFGVAAPTTAPRARRAGRDPRDRPLRLSQVAVEGVGPEQTRKGPGHVPGTAGLGQPGNAAVVGRRAASRPVPLARQPAHRRRDRRHDHPGPDALRGVAGA